MRLALGVDKVALFGVSYGTKHAVAYALAHPTHVERLLLDSEVLPDENPLGPESLVTITPRWTGSASTTRARASPPGSGARLAALANGSQESRSTRPSTSPRPWRRSR